MTKAYRIQMKREKGWKMPEGAINMSRQGPYGNPFDWKVIKHQFQTDEARAKKLAVGWFREWLIMGHTDRLDDPDRRNRFFQNLDEFKEKPLVCWCKLDEPCHVDVILKLVNGSI